MYRLREQQIGSMLIESLIALFILSIGLLGILGLQAKMLSNGNKASERVQASLLTNELIAMATADSANLNCYVVPVSSQVNCNNATSQQFTSNWVSNVTSVLPNATSSAVLAANGTTYTITIQWKLNHEGSLHNYIAVTSIGS